VAGFRLTRRAEADMTEIVRYTLDRWGEDQTARYVDELQSHFELLAESPFAGRAYIEVDPALRRIEFQRHVIFYRPEEGGVVILRILHQRMLPIRHPISDD
jgi:toxin ParE1/3/4